MITIYGSELCPDCVEAKKLFDEKGVSYKFKNITDDLKNLKEFLAIRDKNSLFLETKEKGGIGIPCIVKEDGTLTLDSREIDGEFQPGQACSLDRNGC